MEQRPEQKPMSENARREEKAKQQQARQQRRKRLIAMFSWGGLATAIGAFVVFANAVQISPQTAYAAGNQGPSTTNSGQNGTGSEGRHHHRHDDGDWGGTSSGDNSGFGSNGSGDASGFGGDGGNSGSNGLFSGDSGQGGVGLGQGSQSDFGTQAS